MSDISNRNEIVEKCYYKVATALENKKSKEEIFAIIIEFAKDNGLSIEELSKKIDNVYYKRKYSKQNYSKIEEVHYVFLNLKEKLKFEEKLKSKEANNLSKNKNIKSKKIVSEEEIAAIIEKNNLKAEYSKYFDALINAYNRFMPLDMALDEVAAETGFNAEDIKKNGEFYVLNYASKSEQALYRVKLERFKKTLENPTPDFFAKICVHKIIQILKNNTNNQAKEIRLILSVQDLKVLNRTRTLIIKYFSECLDGVNNLEVRNVLFNREQMILNIIEENARKINNKSECKKVNKENQTQKINPRLHEILQEFMHNNITIDDYREIRLTKYNEKIGHKEMCKLLKQASILENCEEELIIHMQKTEEYEREFLETVLDNICYYLKNGIPVEENIKREFTIIDYYMLTSYPLEKLKLRANALNLLNNTDRKVFMSFADHNIFRGNTLLKINLESILNDLEITKQFGSEYRSLTSDEKIAIYYLLKDNNIPLTFENFNVAVNEYANNRLFLARR